MCLLVGVDSLEEQIQSLSRREEGAEEMAADLMQLLKDQCSIVGRILGDVLSLQKMEEGKFNLELAPFSPELLLRNTVDSFRPSFEHKKLKTKVWLQSLDELLLPATTLNTSGEMSAVGDDARSSSPSEPRYRPTRISIDRTNGTHEILKTVTPGDKMAAQAKGSSSPGLSRQASNNLLVGGACGCCHSDGVAALMLLMSAQIVTMCVVCNGMN